MRNALEADPVRDWPAMTAEGMIVDRWWRQQRRDGFPDGIAHLGLERAHDVGDLHLVVGVGQHPV